MTLGDRENVFRPVSGADRENREGCEVRRGGLGGGRGRREFTEKLRPVGRLGGYRGALGESL